MYSLKYCVKTEDGSTVEGSCELEKGENRISAVLPEGKIAAVTAELSLDVEDTEKIFMNGYQTWTYCPEYSVKDRIRGMQRIPKAAVKHYGLDRYGDYHFVDYPFRSGVLHGESWCYFRKGMDFRLFASLDEKPGYTLFRYDHAGKTLTVTRDCAGLKCGGEYPVFDLYVDSGSEDAVFDGWFKAMGIRPRTTKKLAGYSSWYNRYQNISDRTITEDLEGCCGVLKEGDLFQIDDGWEPAVGDWLEADAKKFPRGMKASADDIHAKGMLAGIWLAPFVCQKDSEIFRKHPDWILKHDGEPWRCGCNWGGFYPLDIDKPEVIAYIEKVFDTVLNVWGFDLVKLDFLYGAAPYGSENETRAGRMIRAMELLRRVCGDKLILGCGVPVMPAFGLVDYCRISCDVGLDWNDSPIMRMAHRERVSTKQAIGNTVFRRQLNGRAYMSDPDVFFLRTDNIRLEPQEKHILTIVNSLFGGLLLCSDNMSKYDEEALEKYKTMLALRECEVRTVENDENGDVIIRYSLGGVERRMSLHP